MPAGIGIPLAALGAMAFTQNVGALRSARRHPDAQRRIRERPLYSLSTATYAVLMGVSVALLMGWVLGLYVLVTLVIWQLAWATRLAWDLLLLAAEHADRTTSY